MRVEVMPLSRADVYGMYHGGIVFLAPNIPEGTEWHELFHALWEVLPVSLTREIFRTANEYVDVASERISALRLLHENESRFLSDERLEQIALEDLLADIFETYMLFEVDYKKMMKEENLVSDSHHLLENWPLVLRLFEDVVLKRFKHLPDWTEKKRE